MPDDQSRKAAKPADRGPADPDPLPGPAAEPTEAEVADAIAKELLAIHTESYGRSAATAKSTLIDDVLVVVLEKLELLPNERFLIDAGNPAAVQTLRDQFQDAIGPVFRAAVERATGRRVVGFSSHIELQEEPFSVEVFRLEPA